MSWEMHNSRRGARHDNKHYFIMVSAQNYSHQANSGRRSVAITLSAAAMQLMGFKGGDRVKIGFDHERRLVGIFKTPDGEAGALTVSPYGGSGNHGKAVRSRIAFTLSRDLLASICGDQPRFIYWGDVTSDNGDCLAFPMLPFPPVAEGL